MKITIEKHARDHSLICKSLHQFATEAVDSIRINYYGDVVVDNCNDESLASEELTTETADYIDIKGALPTCFIYRFYDSDVKDVIIKSAIDYPYFSCRYYRNTEKCSIYLYKRYSNRMTADYVGSVDGYHYITMVLAPKDSVNASNKHRSENASEVANE